MLFCAGNEVMPPPKNYMSDLNYTIRCLGESLVFRDINPEEDSVTL
jgi:hypothetical protein